MILGELLQAVGAREILSEAVLLVTLGSEK